jgi:hypothetical protein
MNVPDIVEEAPWSQPRPNWRKRFIIGGLIALPLCLVLPYVYFVLSSNEELEQALAEADWLDPGWRIPELEQKRAAIPENENSGLVLMAAKAFMPRNWPFWYHTQAPEKGERSEEELRALEESFSEIEPERQLDLRQTKALREELGRAERVLAAVRKVAEMPQGRYPITYSTDFISTRLPYTQDARAFVTLLDYDALLRAQDGDMDGALTSCRGILNCGRSVGDEPTLVSMLVRIALNAVATKRVERTLAQGEPSEAALARVQHEFEAEAEEPLLLIGARGERGMMDGALQAVEAGDLDPNWLFALTGGKNGATILVGSTQFLRLPGVIKRVRAAVLRYNDQFVEITKLPVEQQPERIKELQAAEKSLPELARPILYASTKVAVAFHRDRATLRCAAVMVALERYRRANNRWPGSLTDLVPADLPKVPLDPFDSSPLRYRRLDDGVVVYSVGSDGQDNGGKFDKNPAKEGTDLGLRLWDVSKRRQPPKPVKSSDEEPGYEHD